MNKIKAIEKEVRNIFEKSPGCHDFDHTERVLKMALHIGKDEGADIRVLHYATLLHDIARDEERLSKGEICHAELGAKKARQILTKYELEPEFIDSVAHCIERHRSKKGGIPETIEAKVLFDADKLDNCGAIGVARSFVFAGEIGSRVHDPKPKLGKEFEYTKEDTAYREFILHMSKVKNKLLTKEGRRIAKRRHDFMIKFFDELNRESEGIV
ncbi:MAG: HD domain-containing protein [Patescibacteria group bacterium]